MKEIKVIPCLDVKAGRVVKGVQFINLRDARDPVEAALPAPNKEWNRFGESASERWNASSASLGRSSSSSSSPNCSTA